MPTSIAAAVAWSGTKGRDVFLHPEDFPGAFERPIRNPALDACLLADTMCRLFEKAEGRFGARIDNALTDDEIAVVDYWRSA